MSKPYKLSRSLKRAIGDGLKIGGITLLAAGIMLGDFGLGIVLALGMGLLGGIFWYCVYRFREWVDS